MKCLRHLLFVVAENVDVICGPLPWVKASMLKCFSALLTVWLSVVNCLHVLLWPQRAMVTWIMKRVWIIFVLQPIPSIPGLCSLSSTHDKFMPGKSQELPSHGSAPFQPQGREGWMPSLPGLGCLYCFHNTSTSACALWSAWLSFSISWPPVHQLVWFYLIWAHHISQNWRNLFLSPLTYAQCTQSYFFHSRKKWLFTV